MRLMIGNRNDQIKQRVKVTTLKQDVAVELIRRHYGPIEGEAVDGLVEVMDLALLYRLRHLFL